MSRKQLIALFISNTAPYIIGSALLPLLPVYVRQLGADTSATGLYLGLAFAALAAGTLLSGWLSDRFQRRKLMISLCTLIVFPMVLLMGQARTLEVLAITTMVVWFAAGINAGMVSILTGLYAEAGKRGRAFGIMGISHGVATLIGGFIAVTVAGRWGYDALFGALALTQIVVLGASLLLVDRPTQSARKQSHSADAPRLGRTLLLLIIASTLVYIMYFMTNLARPLAMDSLGFDAAALSSLSVITGAISIPLPFLIGWLSDRVERKQLLILSYVAVNIGALILISATSLGHFWLTAALFAMTRAGMSVGSALITDLVPEEALGRSLSRFAATPWFGGVIGYISAGVVIEATGLQAAFIVSAVLPAIASLLVLSIGWQARRRAHQAPTLLNLRPAHATQEMRRV